MFVSSEAMPKMFLDYKPLFSKDEASPYSENVSWLISVLKEFSVKNIDFLACNTLNFPNWVNYFGVLSSNTSVVVGASNDKTGNIKHGGDWIMESTKADVKLIYFTKSIEYYTYLLDLINVFGYACWGVDVYNGNIYATNLPYNFDYEATGNISKYDLETGTLINYEWANVINNPIAMTIDKTNNFMYVTTTPNISDFISASSGNISKINLLTGAVVNDKWLANLNSISFGLVNDGTFLYVSNFLDINGNISKINLSDGTIVKKDWAKGILGPTALAIDGNYMYVANVEPNIQLDNLNGSIQKIHLSNGTIATHNWASNLDAPFGIAIHSVNNYLYASNLSGNINQINLSDGTISNISWFIEGPPLIGSTISNGNLFVSSFVGIFEFSLFPEGGIQLETQVGPIGLSTLQNCVDIHIVPFKYKQTQIYFKDVINSTHYVTHGYYLPGLQ